MSLRRLLESFAERDSLPIEINEVRDTIVALGIQDRIVLTSVNQPTEEIRGVFYQWTESDGLYRPPVFCTSISYSSRLSLPMQRVVCCKELVHIFDTAGATTKTREEVVRLTERLMGPATTDEISEADFSASTDRVAIYFAMAILLPKKVRDAAIPRVRSGELSVEQLAVASQLPEGMVDLILSEKWADMLALMMDC